MDDVSETGSRAGGGRRAIRHDADEIDRYSDASALTTRDRGLAAFEHEFSFKISDIAGNMHRINASADDFAGASAPSLLFSRLFF